MCLAVPLRVLGNALGGVRGVNILGDLDDVPLLLLTLHLPRHLEEVALVPGQEVKEVQEADFGGHHMLLPLCLDVLPDVDLVASLRVWGRPGAGRPRADVAVSHQQPLLLAEPGEGLAGLLVLSLLLLFHDAGGALCLVHRATGHVLGGTSQLLLYHLELLHDHVPPLARLDLLLHVPAKLMLQPVQLILLPEELKGGWRPGGLETRGGEGGRSTQGGEVWWFLLTSSLILSRFFLEEGILLLKQLLPALLYGPVLLDPPEGLDGQGNGLVGLPQPLQVAQVQGE